MPEDQDCGVYCGDSAKVYLSTVAQVAQPPRRYLIFSHTSHHMQQSDTAEIESVGRGYMYV